MAVNSLGSPSYWRFQIVPFALFIAATTELHLRQQQIFNNITNILLYLVCYGFFNNIGGKKLSVLYAFVCFLDTSFASTRLNFAVS